jgi:SNF2 family DNA or RNA helicase
MLRRTKDQTINGEKLIDLPLRNVNVISCPFDSVEQEFYNALETKMSETLEKLMATKSGNSSYISVLLLLLRLRQGELIHFTEISADEFWSACNHPVLVTKDFKKDSEAIDPKSAKKGASDKDGDGDDLIAAFDQLGVTKKCQFCTAE